MRETWQDSGGNGISAEVNLRDSIHVIFTKTRQFNGNEGLTAKCRLG